MSGGALEHVINVDYAVGLRHSPPADVAKAWVLLALDHIAVSTCCTVNIYFCSRQDMAAAKRDFYGGQGLTDVLAFPASEGAAPADASPKAFTFLGDIMLCMHVIRCDSQRLNTVFEHHLAHVCIHAVLHLLGHDHRKPQRQKIMETLESEIMLKAGYPDPWYQAV